MAAFTVLQIMLLVSIISASGQRNGDVKLRGKVMEDGKCVYTVLMQHQRGEITCQPSWRQLLSRSRRDPGVQGQEGSHSGEVQDDPLNRKQTLEAEKLLVLLRNLTDCDSSAGDCSVDPLIQLQRLELRARELQHENYVCKMNKTFAEWELELKNKDLKVQTNELRGLLSSRENIIRELQERMNVLRQKLQQQGVSETGDPLEQRGFGTDASEYQAITDILPQLQAQEHMLREYETAVNKVIQRTNEQAKVIEDFQHDLRLMDYRVKALARNMTIAMQQEQQGDFRNSEKYFQLQRDLKGELEKYFGKYRDRILSVQERLGKQERLVNQYYNGILEQVQSNQRQDDAIFKMKVELKEIKDKQNISTIEWQNRFNQLISRADLTMVYPQFQPQANVVEGGTDIPEQYLRRLIDLEDTVSIQNSFLNDNTKVVSEMRRSMDYMLLRFANVTREFSLLRRRPPVTITTTTDGSAVDRSMVALLEEYEKRLGELEPRIVQYETKLGYQEEKIRRLEQENQMIRPYLERMSTLEQRMMFLEEATGNGRKAPNDVEQPSREVTHQFNARIVSPPEGSTPYDYDNRVTVSEENQPEVIVPGEYSPRYPGGNIVVPVEGIYVPVPGQPGTGQQTAPPQYTTEPQIPPQYPEPQVPPQYPEPEVPPQYPVSQVPPQYPEPEVPPQYPVPQVPPQYPEQEITPQYPEPQVPQQNPEPEVPPQFPEPEVPPQYPEPEVPPQYPEPEVPPQYPGPEVPQYPEPEVPPQYPEPQNPEPQVPPQYPEPEGPQYPEPEVQNPEPEIPPQYPEPEVPPKYPEPEVPPPEFPEPEREESPPPEFPEPVGKPDDVSTSPDAQGGVDVPVVPVLVTGGADLCNGKPRDCAALYQQGEENSGIHTICPKGGTPFEVWCDMAGQDGPGWTVIQRRLDGSISFDRPWAEYRKGLGDLDTEYWLGNDNLHFLTSQQKYVLRITASAWGGDLRYVDYREFAVANESEEYRASYDRRVSNMEGDFLINGAKFSTWDKDQDTHAYENCASRLGGGGWYTNCGVTANVNGRYYTGGSYLSQTGFPDGLFWAAWEGPWYSMRLTVMKVRPIDFSDE